MGHLYLFDPSRVVLCYYNYPRIAYGANKIRLLRSLRTAKLFNVNSHVWNAWLIQSLLVTTATQSNIKKVFTHNNLWRTLNVFILSSWVINRKIYIFDGQRPSLQQQYAVFRFILQIGICSGGRWPPKRASNQKKQGLA